MSDRPEFLFQWCCQLLRKGDPRANELVSQLEQFPAYADGWMQVGQVLLQANQPDAALVAFSRAVAARPDLTPARLGCATALLALGRASDAAEECAQAEIAAPNAAELPYRRGHCFRHMGRTEAAAAAFERAVALDPRFGRAWFALGLARHDLHDPAGAAAAYRQALAAQPDFHEAALNLGAACQELGDIDSALDAYAIALRLRPVAFGRIAQSLAAGPTGCLWLDLDGLRSALLGRQ